MSVSAIDLRTQRAQENADAVADLEHLANRLVQSPWFREFLAQCERLAMNGAVTV